MIAGLLAMVLALAAGLGSVGAQQRKIVVVTKPFPPFVAQDGDGWEGFSIDLWEEIAERNGYDFEWVGVATVGDQIDAVADLKADAAIAGISMTKDREARVDFSYAFFESGLQIAVPGAGTLTPVEIARRLLSPGLIALLVLGALVTLAVTLLIWIIERRDNPEMPKRLIPGLGTAIWWAVVLLATGTYGNGEAPAGCLRRSFAIFWMIASIFLIAQFTASVTTMLTVSTLQGAITGIEDLPGKRVVAVEGTTGARYLEAEGISAVLVKTAEEGYALLERRAADAMVYDAPVMLHYAQHGGKGKIRLVGQTFRRERYGIALQPGSLLREAINETLLAIREDGTYDRLYDKWFGTID